MITNLRQIKEKYKGSRPDTILERNVVLDVRIKNAKNLYEIVIEDDFDTLEAATANSKILQTLKLKAKSGEKLRLSGFVTKTEYEDLGFEIEEIIE